MKRVKAIIDRESKKMLSTRKDASVGLEDLKEFTEYLIHMNSLKLWVICYGIIHLFNNIIFRDFSSLPLNI